jgi:tetratricopeptide (TPR) repeat protein
LIAGKVTDEAVQAAERATLLSQGNSGDIVDTQAAIYAELGKASEAYTMENHVLELEGLAEPSWSSWYVFGRIAEQYGEREAAVEDYKKCEAPPDPIVRADSSYVLAQQRLKILEAAK